ncbi:MAG: nitrous oxide reductase accessory protein NosL [Sulfurimonas sp.]
MPFIKLFIFIFFTAALFGAPEYSNAYKEKKIYPMGEKIYKQKCQTIDVEKYNSYEELHQAISADKLCQKLSPKYLETLTIYLWDIKRNDKEQQHFEKLTVTKDEKCPVCGMYLYKYPTWIAKIHYNKETFAFDGIKDMFKYYFEHQKEIRHILVQDYYTQKTLDAKKAFFVIGSDVYGPMGNEFLAFETLDSAKKFLLDHKGRKILEFDEIDEDVVYGLDD